MSDEQAKWTITPYLVVSDAKAAIAFYGQAFGAREVLRQELPDGSRVVHATLDLHGAALHLSDDFSEAVGRSPGEGGNPVTLHLVVPDVDAVVREAVAAGATLTMPVDDMFWGDRYGRLVDPFGQEWGIASPQRQPSHEELRQGVERVARR